MSATRLISAITQELARPSKAPCIFQGIFLLACLQYHIPFHLPYRQDMGSLPSSSDFKPNTKMRLLKIFNRTKLEYIIAFSIMKLKHLENSIGRGRGKNKIPNQSGEKSILI